MATYAVGDLQGCLSELENLLELVSFSPPEDRLWLAGDLVNRGPQSLEVLRYLRALGDNVVAVLGNHDLHLLAVASGSRAAKKKDTLTSILEAPDREELLDWLRQRSLLVHDETLDTVMVHAGLAPQWDVAQAKAAAREVESTLRSEKAADFFAEMYGNEPNLWTPDLSGFARLRFITNSLTRIRYCTSRGELDLSAKQPPGKHHESLTPWFKVKNRASSDTRIVFGHWATLQMERPLSPKHNVRHVDTGCVWGGPLSALRLEDDKLFQVPSLQPWTRFK